MRPPKIIKPYVTSFIRNVVKGDVTPFYVQCAPLHGLQNDMCFPLVNNYVREHGGSSVIGWAIWERPKVFIEAELHSIWLTPNGRYVDLSPRPFPIPRILFVPDVRRKEPSFQVNNIRKALTKDKDVHRFLELSDRWFDLLNEGELKYQFGVINKTPEMLSVEKERAAVEFKLINRYGLWLPESETN